MKFSHIWTRLDQFCWDTEWTAVTESCHKRWIGFRSVLYRSGTLLSWSFSGVGLSTTGLQPQRRLQQDFLQVFSLLLNLFDACYRGASPLQDAATTGLHGGGSIGVHTNHTRCLDGLPQLLIVVCVRLYGTSVLYILLKGGFTCCNVSCLGASSLGFSTDWKVCSTIIPPSRFKAWNQSITVAAFVLNNQ